MGNFQKVRDALGVTHFFASSDLASGVTTSPGDATTAEFVRDTIGTALTAGTDITVTVSDGSDTITIAVDSTTIAERIRDTIGAALTAGDSIAVTVNDGSDTITVAHDGTDLYAANAAATGSVTVSFTTARVHKLTLTGNVTLTLSGSTSSKACGLTLYLIQDSTGSRLVTWPGSVKWPGGVAPTLSTAASSVDLVVLETFDGGTTWYANLAGKAYA